MLEQLVKRPSTVRSLKDSPLGPYLDSFASSLVHLGYSALTLRRQVRVTANFGRWLVKGNIQVADLDEEVVDLFVDERRHQGRLHLGQPLTLRRFVEHLRAEGVIPPAQVSLDKSPVAELQDRYERYLRVERGLSTVAVEHYRPVVRRFLINRFGDAPMLLNQLRPSDVFGFVLRHAHSGSPSKARQMVTALRSFFRFLLQYGEIEMDLAVQVPAVADWRLSNVPKYLELEEIERLLSSCDRSTPTGRRNYAILLLLARLGLRAGEVAALELGDIDWRAGEIMIRGKGLVYQRLPLLADVGEALAAYLHHDRPQCHTRRVFVRVRAPHRGFAGSTTVSTLVKRALKRAGLEPPCKGAHILRHSLATGLLRRGASLAEIGEVLRHEVPTTTEIYAKVDLEGLRPLAQPWPGNGGEQ
ncbi:site-specific integrase [Acidobacteria bacterium AH-259-G07]|nr:site-specific integrase [Acidobacteria bacterium AH-259-G07]